jgi:lipopolysaccharide export system protein LptA
MRHARAVAFAAAVALVAAGPPPSPPAQSSGMSLPGMQMNGYQIETETTNWNLNSGDFTMPKDVKVTRPGTDARGDKATGNTKKGVATLIGNVVIHDSGGAPEARDAGQDYQGPATITCDQLTIDSKTRTYDASGNVRFVQGNRIGTADRGVLNQTSHLLHLEGNVLLSEGESSMRANVVDYNLQSRDVVASGGPMVIREPIPPASPGPPASPKPAKKK